MTKFVAEMTDCELADRIREVVANLNDLALTAAHRELIVRYDIKHVHNENPSLRAQVLTEVA